MKTINVVGCGNVGKTLSRLWTRHRVLQVQSILNRSLKSAVGAVDFVGSGHAVESCAQMERADLVMISTSDEAIEGCCEQLCRAGILGEGVVVFHLSGSLPSTLLEPAKAKGALIAAMHPVKSFADPTRAVDTFAGTLCAVEGDPEALTVICDSLDACGATTFPVDPRFKTIYHTGTVVVSNYLVALIEAGLRCLEKAAIPRETALEIIRPIVTGTAENVFELGPVAALTGPIARGERSVVERQQRALGEWDDSIRAVCQSLGRIAAELSAAQGNADSESLAAIRRTLEE